MWHPTFPRFEPSPKAGGRVSAQRKALICSLALLLMPLVWPATPAEAPSPATEQAIDPALAARYFREAEALSSQSGASLWGMALYGPMFFVDPETHSLVANQADREGRLQPKAGVFVGKLPAEIGPANTAIKWAGIEWTMVMWPLPEDRQARLRLMMHECFHRLQPALGMKMRDAVNSHLDSLDGRIWLEMEWRALEHALWEAGEARRQAIADALYFRAFRRSLFPDAAANENALELNEGLAEYTGVKMSTASLAEFAMVDDLKLREALSGGSSFTRSFAYTSGPAYGYLLDARGVNWRRALTSQSDLGQLLADASGIKLPVPARAEATRRAQAYDGDEVMALENARERVRQEKVSAARQRFLEGPVLALPVDGQFNYSFNPHAVLALDADSTLYEGEVQVSDAWGVLKCSEGFLLVRRNGLIVRVQVPAPADANARPLKGDAWTLDLTKGWLLSPGTRAGDYVLKPEPAAR